MYIVYTKTILVSICTLNVQWFINIFMANINSQQEKSNIRKYKWWKEFLNRVAIQDKN